jgi:hypothetical protein
MPKIEILTFDDFKEKGDPFTILCYEDSVFSSSVGGAMVALKEIDIKTVIPLSFGTWLNVKNKPDIRYLDLFVERGTILPPEGATFYSSDFTLSGVGLTHGDELFSTHVVRQEIIDNCTKGKWLATDAKNLIIGKPNSKERKLAEKNVGLKVVSGGEDGKILLMYGGKQVSITKDSPAGILVREGMKIDGKGRATAIIENVSPATRSVRIIYVDKKGNASSGAIPISVNASKIVPVCTLGTIEDVTG